jgi:hypothetical protein
VLLDGELGQCLQVAKLESRWLSRDDLCGVGEGLRGEELPLAMSTLT